MKQKLLLITLLVCCLSNNTISAQAINDTLIKPYKNYVITQRDIDIAKRADKVNLSVPNYLNKRKFLKGLPIDFFDTLNNFNVSKNQDITFPNIVIENKSFHELYALRFMTKNERKQSVVWKNSEYAKDLSNSLDNYLKKSINTKINVSYDALDYLKNNSNVNMSDQIWEIKSFVSSDIMNPPMIFSSVLGIAGGLALTALGLIPEGQNNSFWVASGASLISIGILSSFNVYRKNGNDKKNGRFIFYELTVKDLNSKELAKYSTSIFYECNNVTDRYYRHNYCATVVPALRGLIGQYLNDPKMIERLKNNDEFLSLMGPISDDPEFKPFVNYQIELRSNESKIELYENQILSYKQDLEDFKKKKDAVALQSNLLNVLGQTNSVENLKNKIESSVADISVSGIEGKIDLAKRNLQDAITQREALITKAKREIQNPLFLNTIESGKTLSISEMKTLFNEINNAVILKKEIQK